MPTITTSRGVEILVSDEDYESLSRYKWCINGKGYPVRRVNKKEVHLHRLIAGDVPGFVVDHINRNTLDNRRENLRSVLKSANCRNRKGRMRPAFKKGRKKPWYAYLKITVSGKLKNVSLGFYADSADAQSQIDKYSNMAMELQLGRKDQAEVFRVLSETRAQERRDTKCRLWEKYS